MNLLQQQIPILIPAQIRESKGGYPNMYSEIALYMFFRVRLADNLMQGKLVS